jgi:hypothetical protein
MVAVVRWMGTDWFRRSVWRFVFANSDTHSDSHANSDADTDR